MNLHSKEQNAHYDLTHGQPLAIERDNDGSHLFRWCIEPEMGLPEGEEEGEETQIGWKCFEIRIWETPSFAAIKKNVIRFYLDECDEFSIVNGYNKHVLGVVKDEDAVAEYVSFLNLTEEITSIVNAVINP